MKRFALILALSSVFLWIPTPASAADKVLPEGCLKAVADLLPPDFAGFPPGTEKLVVEFLCKRDAGIVKVEWTFERDAGGALAFRGMETGAVEDPPEGMVFPEKTPAEGPMESLKNCLAAIREKSVEKVKRYVPPEAAEEIESGGAEALGKMGDELAENGLSLEELAKILPRDGVLPPRCNRISIEYGIPAQVKGKAATLKMEAELRLAAEGAPAWVLKDFDPGVKEREGAVPEAKDPAAPEGLRKLFADAPLPDVRGLPAGTRNADIEVAGVKFGRCYKAAIHLRAARENGPLAVSEIEVRPEESLDEGVEAPAAPLLETPLESLRAVIDAMLACDKEKILRYVPRKEREQAAAEIDEMLPKLKEMLEKEKAAKGYNQYEAMRSNLPEAITAPAGAAVFTLTFEVPAEVKGEKGHFGLELAVFVDDPKASHWVMKDAEATFHAAEKEAPGGEKPGEEKGE